MDYVAGFLFLLIDFIKAHWVGIVTLLVLWQLWNMASCLRSIQRSMRVSEHALVSIKESVEILASREQSKIDAEHDAELHEEVFGDR